MLNSLQVKGCDDGIFDFLKNVLLRIDIAFNQKFLIVYSVPMHVVIFSWPKIININ